MTPREATPREATPREATPRTLPREPAPEGLARLPEQGSRIGPYVLRGLLGRGGYGSVFRAFDPRHGREVALKLLEAPSERSRERFKREARAVARLAHPSIVTLLDSGEAEGRPYLVQELIEGATLDERELDLRGRVSVVRDAARAVAYAHAQGVLHRDLKPSNLLVDAAGRGHVIDFGLARVLGTKRLTRSGEAFGTPAFMAPEQAGHGKHPIDERADVYALGATLFATLTGEPPFRGEGFELFLAMFREPAPCPSELDPDLPAALDAVVTTCLAKVPEERYPSADALADDLERWLAGEAVVAQPPSLWQRARGVARAHPLELGLALGLLGGLALGGGGAALILERQAEERQRLTDERERFEKRVAERERTRRTPRPPTQVEEPSLEQAPAKAVWEPSLEKTAKPAGGEPLLAKTKRERIQPVAVPRPRPPGQLGEKGEVDESGKDEGSGGQPNRAEVERKGLLPASPAPELERVAPSPVAPSPVPLAVADEAPPSPQPPGEVERGPARWAWLLVPLGALAVLWAAAALALRRRTQAEAARAFARWREGDLESNSD